MKKALISVTGLDTTGIIARVATRLYELNNSRAPAVLVEIAYHDNASDAEWIKNNLQAIAENLSQSVADYFGVTLIDPNPSQTGIVRTEGGRLNIRRAPDLSATIIGQVPNGSTVNIKGQSGDWYLVNYNGIEGYSYGAFIKLKQRRPSRKSFPTKKSKRCAISVKACAT